MQPTKQRATKKMDKRTAKTLQTSLKSIETNVLVDEGSKLMDSRSGRSEDDSPLSILYLVARWGVAIIIHHTYA